MEENEFKKLSANSRDWLIYSMLSERSKEVFREGIMPDTAQPSDVGVVVFANPKGETTVEEPSVLKNVKIVHETEKAFIVKLIGTQFTTVVAKSHLAEEYSKDDVRTDLIFKNDRKWALEKLKWEEKT